MKMRTVSGIDWLSGTALWHTDLESIIPFSEKKIGQATNGYTECIEYDTGSKIMMNRDRTDMGVHLVMSGSALRQTRSNFEIKEITMVREFIAMGGRISRLDLFLDVFESNMDIEQLSKEYSAGEAKTRARKGSLIRDLLGSGMTFYVGKRGSRKFLRIYDKAAELGKSGDWVRIEIELRKDAAMIAAKIIANNKDWQSFVPGIIDDFVTFPENELWNIVLAGVPVEIGVAPKEVSKTEEWLINVCAPSLGRLAAKGENTLFERFVERALREKRKEEDSRK